MLASRPLWGWGSVCERSGTCIPMTQPTQGPHLPSSFQASDAGPELEPWLGHGASAQAARGALAGGQTVRRLG